uniref:Uncharacterized protein n=1 Tax=Chromera velia CCMP2878 TaxID=1169474 RepID=A0A0G4HDY8_9ALVE|eukprot:Cvel_26623.t1-p1 / transcript=Cvel_26623.t1 / gene=Cvel_26623 / organism=Chromera_velia_CCMP2878 / gene_product=hypothetical protein / transcript_product=hypothetical protein / location=Cvel_scaffold3197:2271-3424(-) / protein_length=321 / sequence_SO=supercontig / SO=protein_coding / is_pseudo=false
MEEKQEHAEEEAFRDVVIAENLSRNGGYRGPSCFYSFEQDPRDPLTLFDATKHGTFDCEHCQTSLTDCLEKQLFFTDQKHFALFEQPPGTIPFDITCDWSDVSADSSDEGGEEEWESEDEDQSLDSDSIPETESGVDSFCDSSEHSAHFRSEEEQKEELKERSFPGKSKFAQRGLRVSRKNKVDISKSSKPLAQESQRPSRALCFECYHELMLKTYYKYADILSLFYLSFKGVFGLLDAEKLRSAVVESDRKGDVFLVKRRQELQAERSDLYLGREDAYAFLTTRKFGEPGVPNQALFLSLLRVACQRPPRSDGYNCQRCL